MTDPFNSAWVYLLLLLMASVHGTRNLIGGFLAGTIAYVLSYVIRSTLPESWSFPSISVALISALAPWVLGPRARSVPGVLSMLLVLCLVSIHRTVFGEHSVIDVVGGVALGFLALGAAIQVVRRRSRVNYSTSAETQTWFNASYVPPGLTYKWSRAEVAERYPNSVQPLFGDLFLPPGGRAIQKMGRLLGIKKPEECVGYSLRDGYVLSNLGLWTLNIPGVLKRLVPIRRDFLEYYKQGYPAARTRFWDRHRRLGSQIDSVREFTQLRIALLQSIELFEDWMTEQTISLMYVTFAGVHLKLMVHLCFPLGAKRILDLLPKGLRTVSHEESQLLYQLGKEVDGVDCQWDDLTGNAALLGAEILQRARDRSATYDFFSPTLNDNRGIILEMARSAAAAPTSPEARLAALARERVEGEEELRKRLRLLVPFHPHAAEELVELSRNMVLLKEERQVQMAAAWGLVRETVKNIGKHLQVEELLESWEDVYFLRASELGSVSVLPDCCAGGQEAKLLRARITVRKDEWEWNRAHDDGAENFEDGGVLELPWKKPRRHLEPGTYKGKYSLPGEVEGAAILIRGVEEFGKMRSGAILVAPMTNPHWDSLFWIASGIVVEKGGPQCHAMLKASELGLPAIIGIEGVTESIRDGDRVRLDGRRGLLHVVQQDE